MVLSSRAFTHPYLVCQSITTTYMTENDSDWIATTTYNIWASKDAASKNLPYIQQDFVKTAYDPKDNPFAVLYKAIKAKYTSTTDC